VVLPEKRSGINLVEKIQPLSYVALQQPEEQTDNWDDDFEDGISFTKLQGVSQQNGESRVSHILNSTSLALEKSTSEEEKHEIEDNARTIRPTTRSPGQKNATLAQPPASGMQPIVEDYSDLALEEDEVRLEEKVADFKVRFFLRLDSDKLLKLYKLKNSRRGLFHPDDINTIGLAASGTGPMSAPLPTLSRKSSRPSISPRGTLGQTSGSGVVTPISATSAPGSASGHTRSGSFASGSFGRAEFQKQRAEFGKYAEDDEEDYDDVFAKPSNTCKSFCVNFGSFDWLQIPSFFCLPEKKSPLITIPI